MEKRIGQIYKLAKEDNKFIQNIEEINSEIIKNNPKLNKILNNVIKYHINENKLSISNIIDLSAKVANIKNEEVILNLWVVDQIYNLIVKNILLPDYTKNLWTKEIEDELIKITQRTINTLNKTTTQIDYVDINIENIELLIKNILDYWFIPYRQYSINETINEVWIWSNWENLPISACIKLKLSNKTISKKELKEVTNNYFNNKWIWKISEVKNIKFDIQYLKNNKWEEAYITLSHIENSIINTTLNIDNLEIEDTLLDLIDWQKFLVNDLNNIYNLKTNSPNRDIKINYWAKEEDEYIQWVMEHNQEQWEAWKTKNKINFEDFKFNIKEKISLNHIWWHNWVKEDLNWIIKLINNKEIAKKYNIDVTQWIIFKWPAWTWKTLFAKAIASEVDWEIYVLKATDIQWNAYLNHSANRVSNLFDFLKDKSSKSDKHIILLIDEIDALLPNRDDKETSWEDKKLVNAFLTWMQWIDTDNKNITFIWTTNNYNWIDNAIKRSWRFSKEFEIWLPKENERLQVLEIYINKYKNSKENILDLFQEINLEQLSKISDKLSQADLEEVVKNVIRQKAIDEIDGKSDLKITTQDFINQIEIIKKKNIKWDTKIMWFWRNN